MSTRTVIAVRQDNNGDVLLAGPALRALAAGASRLVLVCGPSGEPAARALPGIDDVIVHEAGWIEANPQPVHPAATAAFVERIAALHAAEAIVFTSFHQSALPTALLLRLAGVPRISAISDDYPGALLDVRVRDLPDAHEVERNLALARGAGYTLPPHDEGRLAMWSGAHNPAAELAPYVVVHPGATVAARAWSPDANRDLVRALAARGERVVVTGGTSERELCAQVADGTATDLAGRTSFSGLASVIAGADVIVVGNTGAAHVAAAVGTPVVSLFAPTIPAARFRPWMVEHVVLGDQEIGCRGCRARTCPIPSQPCLSAVTVDDVLVALGTVRRDAPATRR